MGYEHPNPFVQAVVNLWPVFAFFGVLMLAALAVALRDQPIN